MQFLLGGNVQDLLSTYGYWLVAGVIGLESMGLALPGETTLIAAAVIAGSGGGLDIRLVIAAAAGGAILGDNAGYWLGHAFGHRLLLRYGRYVAMSEGRIRLGQYLFLRYGGWVVFFGRFVAVLRALAALLAGTNYMPWRRFLVANAAGAVAWAGGYGLAAYGLGQGITRVAGPVGIALAVGAVIAVAVAVLFLRRHEAELQKKAARALPGPLRPLHKRHRASGVGE